MKKLTAICMAILAMVAMVSCRGPMGPQGPAGQDGHDGNANVTSSTLTVRSNDWYWDNTSWRVDIRYEAINADINNTGAVLVYMDDMSDGSTWRQLPMTFYYYDSEHQVYCSSSLEVSSYREGVSIFWTENDLYDGYRPDDHRFKIVVIAAGLYDARSDVDYSDYQAVKQAFQLAD